MGPSAQIRPCRRVVVAEVIRLGPGAHDELGLGAPADRQVSRVGGAEDDLHPRLPKLSLNVGDESGLAFVGVSL